MRKLISTSALVAGFIALAVVIVALGLHYYPSTWSTAVRMTCLLYTSPSPRD